SVPRVARWYKAKESRLKIEVVYQHGGKGTPVHAQGIALCQDLPAERPRDLDVEWYIGQAWRAIRKRAKKQGRGEEPLGYDPPAPPRPRGAPAALALVAGGLVPCPKPPGKAQPAGSSAQFPSYLWDWSSRRYDARGTYTGPKVGLLVVDVDAADKFRK